MAAWGFQPLAYAGLETGLKDRVSYVVKQDKIRLVLTSPLKSGGEINKHIDFTWRWGKGSCPLGR